MCAGYPWASDHLNISFRGTTTMQGTIQCLSLGRWNGVRPWPGSYFPAWPDVLQLNAFAARAPARRLSRTIRSIAEQCEGIRCDMAMLVLNDIFERTWGGVPESNRSTITGRRLSTAIKEGIESSGLSPRHTGPGVGAPTTVRLLLRQKLYDRMEHGNAESVPCTSWQILLTSKEWSGSSRTMHEPGLPPPFRTEKGVPQPW